jgi:hypothetical protein
MTILNRKDGRYGYVITRVDDPLWAEVSLDTFDSFDDASVAAGEALQRFAQAIQRAGPLKI